MTRLGDVRWRSQLAGDSSPQRTFDFMNIIEERFIFHGTDDDIAATALQNGSLKDCFHHVRRTMGCQIIGLANADTTQKFLRVDKNLRFETAPGDLDERRGAVVGWLADQGADLAIGESPNISHSDLVTLIRNNDYSTTPEGRDGFYLPNSVTIAETMHQLFGGLRDALTSTEAWKAFEPVFREIVTALGNKMFRDRFIGTCMQTAEAWEKRRIHSFTGHKLFLFFNKNIYKKHRPQV